MDGATHKNQPPPVDRGLSLQELTALREAAEKATPGPWNADDGFGFGEPRVMGNYDGDADDEGRMIVTADEVCTGADGKNEWADLTYIALANPATILKLLAALEPRPLLLADEREAVARIIDPKAWSSIEDIAAHQAAGGAWSKYWADRSALAVRERDASLAKADAILALTRRTVAVEGGDEGISSSREEPDHLCADAGPYPRSQEAADARRYRYLRDHCSSHYPMSWEQPAEWSIGWEFQQSTPEQAYGSFDKWIDAEIALHEASVAEDAEPSDGEGRAPRPTVASDAVPGMTTNPDLAAAPQGPVEPRMEGE